MATATTTTPEARTLNKFEAMKADRDGLDALADIERYAADCTPIDAIPEADLQRMKWYGVFHRPQTPGEFMMRLRLAGGVLTATQARGIAQVAREFGHGAVDLTTRENIQLRGLHLTDLPAVFEVLRAAGVEHRQTGLDNVRNFVVCPLAGIDADEIFDARALLEPLASGYLGNGDYSNLPRKFNVAIGGCREDCTDARSHDLAFVPSTRLEGGALEAGFNVLVGGALGGTAPRLATPLDAFVRPGQVPALFRAVLRVFRDHGGRDVRTRARLKWLLEDWGEARFRAAVEREFAEPLTRAGRDVPTAAAGDHLGVHPQREAELRFVGLHVPVGRLAVADLEALATLAEAYGSGELRLTAGQNVILPHIPAHRVAPLLEEPLLSTLSPQPSNVWRGLAVCTGNDYCHYSLIDTKSRALELAHTLEARGVEPRPGFRLHMSGCVHACGKHHIADIGLQGANARVDGAVVEAADIYVDGRTGPDARLGRRVQRQLPITAVADAVAALIAEQAATVALTDIGGPIAVGEAAGA